MPEKPRSNGSPCATRLAMEFQDGWIVNLGVGMPTLCSNYVDSPQEPHLSLGERRDRLRSAGHSREGGSASRQRRRAAGHGHARPWRSSITPIPSR